MRIVQLIDSLEPGGAERMAVNIANGLSKVISFSALVVTRRQGSLLDSVNKNVNYAFLNKKSIFDIKSVLKFRSYLIKHKITIIHAHGSSYFFAVLIKISYPKIKIFWHDHNGNRIHLKKTNWILKSVSFLFSGIFTVNDELKNWAQKKLLGNNIQFIPNFAVINSLEIGKTILKGVKGKRIICLANLRYPKNHMMLLQSFLKSDAVKLGWSLHLIGNDKYDNYSNLLKQFVKNNNLLESVFFYGGCDDIGLLLKQASIGVLVSTYEGFPVTLLEYGLANLPVVSTNVGYCKSIIKNNKTGLLFNPHNEIELIENLNNLIVDDMLRLKLSNNFYSFILENYSESVVLEKIIQYYNQRN